MVNLIEELNNAPLGLELYSPMFGKVCFRGVINGQVRFSDDNNIYYANANGQVLLHTNTYTVETMLFPKEGILYWSNWQDMLFKTGDIVKDKNGNIGILIKNDKQLFEDIDKIYYIDDKNHGEIVVARLDWHNDVKKYTYTNNSEKTYFEMSLEKQGYKIMSDKDGEVIGIIRNLPNPGDIVCVNDDDIMLISSIGTNGLVYCQDENAKEHIVNPNSISKVTNPRIIDDFNNSLAENGYYWSRTYKGLKMAGDLHFNLGDYIKHVETGEKYLIASYEDEENGTGYYGILEGNMITSRQIRYGREQEFIIFDAKPELLFREKVKRNEEEMLGKETNSEAKEIEKRIIKGFIENLMKEYKITPDMLNLEERILTVNDDNFENTQHSTFGDYEDIQEKYIENKTLFDELEYTR